MFADARLTNSPTLTIVQVLCFPIIGPLASRGDKVVLVVRAWPRGLRQISLSATSSPPPVILANFSMLESATMRCLRLDVDFEVHLILYIDFSYKTLHMKPTILFR